MTDISGATPVEKDACTPKTTSVVVKNCNVAAELITSNFDACNGTAPIVAKNVFDIDQARGKWTLKGQPSTQIGQVKLNGVGVDKDGSIDAGTSNELTITNMTAAGTYHFVWEVRYGDADGAIAKCPQAYEFAVENATLTTKADTDGPNAEISVCGDTYTLRATNHDPNGYTFKWTDANDQPLAVGDATGTGFRISNSSTNNATVYGIPSSGKTIKWTVTKTTQRQKTKTVHNDETDKDEEVLEFDDNNNPVMETVETDCKASDVVTLTNEREVAFASVNTNPICDGTAELISSNTINEKLTGKWSYAVEGQSGKFVYNNESTSEIVVTSTNKNATTVSYEGIEKGNTVKVYWTVSKMLNGKECPSKPVELTLTNNDFDIDISGGSKQKSIDCSNTTTLTGSTSASNYTGWWTSDGGVAKFKVGTETTLTEVSSTSVDVVNLSNNPTGNLFVWHVQKLDADSKAVCEPKTLSVTVYNNKPVAEISAADKGKFEPTEDEDGKKVLVINCDANLELSANSLQYSVDKGQWIGTGGASFSDDGTKTGVTVSNMSNGEVTITWKVTRETEEGGKCIAEDAITFLNKSYTPKIITDVNILDDCKSSVTLEANPPTADGVTGYWTCDDESVTIGDQSSNASITVQDLPYGPTKFHWYLSGACGTIDDEITINNKQVNGNPGEDDYICVNYYTMKAHALSESTAEGTWSIASQPAGANAQLGENSHNINMGISNLGRGDTKLKWTVVNHYDANDNTKICTSEKYVTLHNMDFDIDALAGSTETTKDICGSKGELNPVAPAPGYEGVWSSTGATFDAVVDEDDPTNVASSIKATKAKYTLSGTEATFKWTVTRTFKNDKNEDQTCSKDDYVTVYDRTPQPSAESNLSTCDGTKALNASVADAAHEKGFWSKNANEGKFEGFTGDVASTNAVTITGIKPATQITLKWNVESTRTGLENCVASTPVVLTNYYYKPTAEASDTKFCPTFAVDGKPQDKDINIKGSLPGSNVEYTGEWTATGVTISESTSPSTTATFAGDQGGKFSLVWTVTPKDGPACVQDNANTDAVTITNMYPGTPSIETIDEVICKSETDEVVLTANDPADSDVTGKWSSSTTASVITETNQNSNVLSFVPARGVNKFTWTLEREGNTYADCKLSKDITFDNKYVKAEVVSTVFESCDNTATLTAIKVWDKYAGSEGWWSTNDDAAYFAGDGDTKVKSTKHGSSSANNLNVATAYGIPGTGATFYWHVKNGNPDENKGCADQIPVTVNNNGIPAEVVSKKILLCNTTTAHLQASALGNIEGAHGQWKCVKAPDGVTTAAVTAKISKPNEIETDVTDLDVDGGIYEFEWSV